MLQRSMSMWSAVKLLGPLLWSKSYQPDQGRQHVKKRLGQGTVALTLFPLLTHAPAVPHELCDQTPGAWAQPFCHRGEGHCVAGAEPSPSSRNCGYGA